MNYLAPEFPNTGYFGHFRLLNNSNTYKIYFQKKIQDRVRSPYAKHVAIIFINSKIKL